MLFRSIPRGCSIATWGYFNPSFAHFFAIYADRGAKRLFFRDSLARLTDFSSANDLEEKERRTKRAEERAALLETYAGFFSELWGFPVEIEEVQTKQQTESECAMMVLNNTFAVLAPDLGVVFTRKTLAAFLRNMYFR